MTPVERFIADGRRVMRKQRLSETVRRIGVYAAEGGPRLQGGRGPNLVQHLAGGGGTTVSLMDGGRMWIPAVLAGIQQGLPREAPVVHPGCCHCLSGEAARRRRASVEGVDPMAGATVGSTSSAAAAGAQLGRRHPAVPGPGEHAVSGTSLMFDVHGHVFGSTLVDYLISTMMGAWGAPNTDTFQRIAWLTEDLADAGVTRMAISGFFDGEIPPPGPFDWRLGEGPNGPSEVNYTVKLATELHPDYFVPFLNGIDLTKGDPTDAIKGEVGAWPYWRGVGEFIVHGHGGAIADTPENNERIASAINTATDLGLPVMFHFHEEASMSTPEFTRAAGRRTAQRSP